MSKLSIVATAFVALFLFMFIFRWLSAHNPPVPPDIVPTWDARATATAAACHQAPPSLGLDC